MREYVMPAAGYEFDDENLVWHNPDEPRLEYIRDSEIENHHSKLLARILWKQGPKVMIRTVANVLDKPEDDPDVKDYISSRLSRLRKFISNYWEG